MGARTGEPYSHVHVLYVAQASGKHAYQPRPRFRDAYNAVANAAKDNHRARGTGENEWYTPAEYVEETGRRHAAPVDPDYV